jgi:hypothetical protein
VGTLKILNVFEPIPAPPADFDVTRALSLRSPALKRSMRETPAPSNLLLTQVSGLRILHSASIFSAGRVNGDESVSSGNANVINHHSFSRCCAISRLTSRADEDVTKQRYG